MCAEFGQKLPSSNTHTKITNTYELVLIFAKPIQTDWVISTVTTVTSLQLSLLIEMHQSRPDVFEYINHSEKYRLIHRKPPMCFIYHSEIVKQAPS